MANPYYPPGGSQRGHLMYHANESHGERLVLPSQPFARGYSGCTPDLHGQGGRSQDVQRPDSPFDGVYEDRPPVWEKLNPQQREIVKQFPPGIDDEDGGKSGFQAVKDLLKNWKQFFKLKYLHWWIILLIAGAVVALVTIYHDQIVDWLTPISKKANSVSWGWTIPVAILFVLSFPPLFGQEIVLVLIGIVYGLWLGFGIASLGTLLGEIGNFFVFKYFLQGTAAKYERKNIYYACMAEMVREGGFWVMFLARLSAVPGHFTTAVFATVGMNIWIFTLAAILALPKQLIIVYFGVAIEQAGDGGESTASKVIKYVVLAATVIITIWTAHWLYKRMEKVRPDVQRKLRQRRYNLLTDARGSEHRGGQTAIDVEPMQVNRELDYGNDDFELQPRKQAYGGYGGPSQGPYDAAIGYGRYYGADASYNDATLVASRQRQAGPPPTHSGGTPILPTAPIQFHRPLRSQTPPIGSRGYDKGSDLSQARAELMRSPTSPVGGGSAATARAARPNIRLDTQFNGKYQHASEIGSVYLPASEVSSMGPLQGSFQSVQIVSPSSLTPPGQDTGAPVPALQSPHGEHFSERMPLRGADEEYLSPVSPGASHQAGLESHHGMAWLDSDRRATPTSTAGHGVGQYDRGAPPAYASTTYLPHPSVSSQPQQRVSDEVTRYQLRD